MAGGVNAGRGAGGRTTARKSTTSITSDKIAQVARSAWNAMVDALDGREEKLSPKEEKIPADPPLLLRDPPPPPYA